MGRHDMPWLPGFCRWFHPMQKHPCCVVGKGSTSCLEVPKVGTSKSWKIRPYWNPWFWGSQFKKPLSVVRSLATSTGENDPENLHLDQRRQAPSPMARRTWMPRSPIRQSRPSWGFRSEFSRALRLKLLVYIWWKVSDDMLIQESVLAAKPGAMILAVAQLFCLPASDTGYLQNWNFKQVILDDAWFSWQDVFLWSPPAELMTRISLAKLEGERVSKLPLRNDELSVP